MPQVKLMPAARAYLFRVSRVCIRGRVRIIFRERANVIRGFVNQLEAVNRAGRRGSETTLLPALGFCRKGVSIRSFLLSADEV